MDRLNTTPQRNPKLWELLLNHPTCKKTLMLGTLIIFSTYSILLILNRPTADLKEILLLLIAFWTGRASKVNQPCQTPQR